MAKSTNVLNKAVGVLLKKKKTEDEGPKADMLSFASVMTILLAFFIMLSTYAGRPEEELSEKAIESFKEALQNFGLSDTITGSSDSINNIIFALRKIGGRSTKADRSVMSKSFANLIDKEIEITYKREDRYLVFPTKIDFIDGGEDLTPTSKAYLSNFIKLVRERDCNILVRGYTGKGFVPTDEYPTSWQSSAEHAAAVTKYLHEEGRIDYRRLTAIGHGKYQTLLGDDSTSGAQPINRISIIISNKEG